MYKNFCNYASDFYCKPIYIKVDISTLSPIIPRIHLRYHVSVTHSTLPVPKRFTGHYSKLVQFDFQIKRTFKLHAKVTLSHFFRIFHPAGFPTKILYVFLAPIQIACLSHRNILHLNIG